MPNDKKPFGKTQEFKKTDVMYKLNWNDVIKWNTQLPKCGNCSAETKELHMLKYSVNEYDPLLRTKTPKTKSKLICGRCNWFANNFQDAKKGTPQKK